MPSVQWPAAPQSSGVLQGTPGLLSQHVSLVQWAPAPQWRLFSHGQPGSFGRCRAFSSQAPQQKPQEEPEKKEKKEKERDK